MSAKRIKKKTTVLVALISMCVIVTAGIGAVSASDEPVGKVVITVFRLNQTDPEAPPIPIKTFEGSGPMSVTVIGNEHNDSANIIKEDKNGITEYKFENDALTTETMKLSERIDASARTRLYIYTTMQRHTTIEYPTDVPFNRLHCAGVQVQNLVTTRLTAGPTIAVDEL